MFKKLRQRLEEGSEGSLDRIGLLPEKLPGSVVRTISERDAVSPSAIGHPEEGSEPSVDTEIVTTVLAQSHHQQGNGLPQHLTSQPSPSYQALLETQVEELKQECSHLNEQLLSKSATHLATLNAMEEELSDSDKSATELKMQLIEAELEKVALQQEHDKTTRQLNIELEQQRRTMQEVKTTVEEFRSLIEDKDLNMIRLENDLEDMEKKANNFESQLMAYKSASENAVVSRLYSEIADIQHKVQARNVDIQILETRLAAQTKEKDQQIEELLDRLEELDKQKITSEQVALKGKAMVNKLLKEVEEEKRESAAKVKEEERLKAEVYFQTEGRQKLVKELEDAWTHHTKQVHDLEVVIQDQNNQIKDLLQQVRQFQAENMVVLEPLSRPPGFACRTVSTGVQTCDSFVTAKSVEKYTTDREPVDRLIEDDTNMTSLKAANAVMKNHQSKLEDELAEKVKIVKLQQQNIIELKKELRLLQKSKEDSGREKSHSPSPPIKVAIASEVNFQYLKHVVIRFMCSHPNDAMQLIRAISTLLEFSPQEEEHVKNYLDYKMSWFGSLPSPLFVPLQPTI